MDYARVGVGWPQTGRAKLMPYAGHVAMKEAAMNAHHGQKTGQLSGSLLPEMVLNSTRIGASCPRSTAGVNETSNGVVGDAR
jgi:hypothetical protein